MESLEKRFFNLLALVKYVLESKACVPFPVEENTRPFRKPSGYELYQDDNDRDDFDNLENGIKKEIEEKVKRFHYFRNKFEELSKSIIILTGIKGGQHTITIDLFRLLMARFQSKDIKVEYSKKCDLCTFMSDNLKGHISNETPKSFWKNLIIKKPKNKIAELYHIKLSYGESKISTSAFVYDVDGKISFISFVENSTKNDNGELVFEKIEKEVDRIIRLLPIIDIL